MTTPSDDTPLDHSAGDDAPTTPAPVDAEPADADPVPPVDVTTDPPPMPEATPIVVVSTAAPARTSATSRHAPSRRALPRRIGALAAFALLAGGVLVGTAVVVERVRDDGTTVTDDPSALFKTSAVASGSLTTTERIDASVSLSETTAILHRIEGQSSSSVVGSGASSPGGTSAFPSGLMGTAAAESVIHDAVDPCATSTTTTSSTPSTSTTTTLGGPPSGSIPTGSIPTGSIPTGSIPGGSSLTASFAGTATTDAASSTTDDGSTTTAPATTATTSTTDATGGPATSSSTSSSSSTPDSTPGSSTLPATTTTECDTSTSTTSTMPGTTTTSPESTTTLPGGLPTGGFPTGGGTGSGTTGGSSSSGTSASTAVTQTITSVIEVGSEVSLGDVLYTVEGTKVVAMAGVLPAWRTLEADIDPGQDILQLELSLTALGYDPDGELVVDTEWDDATEAAVEAWQEGLGQEATGVVELGSIVFLPTVTDVVSVSVTVGDEVGDGDTILTVSSPAQSVVIDVPDGTESVIVPGLVVSIGDVEGTVSYLRSVERDGSVVVQAVITPSAELEGATDGSTASVQVVIEGADGVLLVPTEAIVSKLDGNYAVQVATDGTSNPSTATWVEVEVLGQVGTQVGVRGDGLTAGAEVLLPV